MREVKVATLSQNALRVVRATAAPPRIRVLDPPRINPCPLPDIRTPLPAALSPPLTASRSWATHRHRRQEFTDEPGYASAMESSAALRPRPSFQVVRTSLAPAPPLKGILKTGESNPKIYLFR